MNDLRVKCVRKLGRKIGQLLLEQNLLLLSGAECFYLLWVERAGSGAPELQV